MGKAFANGRMIVHKGDGQTNVCTVPDVCKTPSPGGPVPIPYVNVAKDSDLASGASSVQIEGNPVAKQDSNLSTSTGDEAGTAGGGLISSKTKGKMTWSSASLDVKVEGKGVARFLDVTGHNGNTFNSAWAQNGNTGLAYGDDPVGDDTKCPLCRKEKADHRVHQSEAALGYAVKLMAALENVRTKKQHLQVLKSKGAGYMIGALICKCGKRVYAAMSGNSAYLAGFNEAVSDLKKEKSAVTWHACTPLGPGSTIRNPKGETFLVSDLPPVQGGNPPGACAAPQCIQQVQADGHQPGALSEVYYSPKKTDKTVTVSFVVYEMAEVEDSDEQEEVANTVEQEFTHGNPVPSCKTCQTHLTPQLCQVKDKDCP